MVLHREHPIFLYKDNPVAYLSLLRTYIDFDVPYWIDPPFSQGRMRLTNQWTGEYVIYGDLGEYAVIDLDTGIDEFLHMNVPEGYLRGRDVTGEFTKLKMPDEIEYLGVLKYFTIRVIQTRSGIHYDTNKGDISELLETRKIQYEKLKRPSTTP